MLTTRFFVLIALLAAVLPGCDSGSDGLSLTGTWDTTVDVSVLGPDGTTVDGTSTLTYVLTQSDRDVRGTLRSATRIGATETVSEPAPVAGTADGATVSLTTNLGGGRTRTVAGTFSETEMRLRTPGDPEFIEPLVYRRR